MKRDLVLAAVAIALIAALCYGVTLIRPPHPPTRSQPYTASAGASGGPSLASSPVVLRVNGDPVTEEEFRIAYEQLPEEMQAQFASDAGKQAVAERIVRMKLLEQEGRRLGLDKEPKVAAQLALSKTNAIAQAALQKLQTQPSEAQVREFYEKNKAQLESIDLAHILIAYQGGEAPPRDGAQPLPREAALQKARQIYDSLRSGADFAAMARQYSDDSGSAQNGGNLGQVGRGMLPPDLDSVVFAIPAGQIGQPTVSRFGVHIFKVLQKRTAPLAEVRAHLAQNAGRQQLSDRVEKLRSAAKVEFDPKFFPASKTPQTTTAAPARKPS